MIRTIILTIILFLTCNIILADIQCEKCDITKVKIVNEHLDSLTFEIVNNFLCTFDSSCKSNTEYSEWSNETLFKVIKKAPTIFFQVIEKGEINNELLLIEIENPIRDFEIQKIYNQIKTKVLPSDLKEKYLKALETAINKPTTEDKIYDTILKLKEVKERAEYIERESKGARHIRIEITERPSETNGKYYWVRVGEINDIAFVTHFNFIVYQDKFEIKYYDTKKDAIISLVSWRQGQKNSK
ncbi:MAG: hypothetical protein WCK02_10405 [Bacteroidota bacterium]